MKRNKIKKWEEEAGAEEARERKKMFSFFCLGI